MAGDIAIAPNIANESGGLCTGSARVVQRFLLGWLNTAYQRPYESNGVICPFAKMLRQGLNIGTVDDLRSAFNFSLPAIRNYVLQWQPSDAPPEETFVGARLADLTIIDNDTVHFDIVILTQTAKIPFSKTIAVSNV